MWTVGTNLINMDVPATLARDTQYSPFSVSLTVWGFPRKLGVILCSQFQPELERRKIKTNFQWTIGPDIISDQRVNYYTMVVKRFTLSDFSIESEEDETKKEETTDVITDNLGEIGR